MPVVKMGNFILCMIDFAASEQVIDGHELDDERLRPAEPVRAMADTINLKELLGPH